MISELVFHREGCEWWVCEVPSLPGCAARSVDRAIAARASRVLALRVLADRLENGELIPEAFIPTVYAGALGPALDGDSGTRPVKGA